MSEAVSVASQLRAGSAAGTRPADGPAGDDRADAGAEPRAQRPALRALTHADQRPAGGAIREDPIFRRQRSTSADLPDPEPLIVNLARCVLEIFAGVRDLEQVARWVTEDVYRHLLTRAQHSARARQARRVAARRPHLEVRRATWQSPSDGVIEAVVLIDLGPRVRAVAVRLEGFDRRWRATSVNVL